jgi:predicted membrane-bound spermidine synthase
VPIATYIAGMGTGWWWVAGQLLASAVILLSVKQDLGLRARMGAALGSFMAIAFGISALVSAIRVNLRGGAAICAVVLCVEILLILRWIRHRQNERDS